MRKLILFLAGFVFCTGSFAQDPALPALSFQTWKEQQILESQNQVLRSSARLTQLKSNKAPTAGLKDSATLTSSKIKKSEDTVSAAERDLLRAQESLQTANGLTLEDYVSIYLPSLQDQPESLHNLVQKFTREELAEMVKMLVNKGVSSSSNARRNNTFASSKTR